MVYILSIVRYKCLLSLETEMLRGKPNHIDDLILMLSCRNSIEKNI